jgi:GNAT superfamily N-acetyltransferase
MPDMLAKLYWQPPIDSPNWANDIWNLNVEIVRPDIGQKSIVLDWVRKQFSAWTDQAEAAFTNRPLTIFIAVHERREICGFACFDVTRRNFFGPTGVSEAWRGKSIGTALLIHCFNAMREAGYEYAIIHAVGPVAFYAKTVGAEVIPDSEAGTYRREINQ